MKALRILTVAAWMAGVGSVAAQGLVDRADRAAANLNYPRATRLYGRAMHMSANGDIAHKLSGFYLQTGEPDKAVQAIAPYCKSAQSKPEWHLAHARALQASGKYAEASKAYNQYALKGDDPASAQAWAAACDAVAARAAQPTGFEVRPMPFNSPNSEIGAVQTPAGTWLAVNQSRGGLVHPIDPTTEKGCYDLVVVQGEQAGKVFAAAKGRINSKYHDGPVTFTPQADTAYLTRSIQMRGKLAKDAKGYNHLQVLESHLLKGRWSKAVPMPFCDAAYSTAHAYLSPDRKWLYFASDRPGGYGGSDIYRVARTASGWGKPENLGPAVNSGGEELFPAFHGSTLYFATDGRPGLGGLDLHASVYSDGSWAEARNLGAPVNSAGDDFAMYWNAKGLAGTISSNRAGGKGSDDIYRFTQKIWMEVEAVSAHDKTAVPGSKLNLLGTRGTVVNLVTDEAGKAGFFAQGNEDFKLSLTHNRFEPGNALLTADAADAEGKLKTRVALAPLQFLEGVVVDKATGKALPAAQVHIVQGSTRQNLTAGNDGGFSWQATEHTKARVVAYMPGYKPAILEMEPSAGSQKPKSIKLEPGDFALIQGKCVRAGTGEPVAGAKVRALDSASTRLLDSDYAMADGGFFLSVPRGDVHRLLGSGQGYFVSSLELGPQGLRASDTTLTLAFVECKVGEIVKVIHFDYKRSEVKALDAAELNEVVVFLQENPEASLAIESHTDCRGSDAANLQLSNERAKASKDYLVSKKVQASRITAVGVGETKPVNQCKDAQPCEEAQHAENRRAEFRITRIQPQEK